MGHHAEYRACRVTDSRDISYGAVRIFSVCEYNLPVIFKTGDGCLRSDETAFTVRDLHGYQLIKGILRSKLADIVGDFQVNPAVDKMPDVLWRPIFRSGNNPVRTST
jgi:hypothetical protein